MYRVCGLSWFSNLQEGILVFESVHLLQLGAEVVNCVLHLVESLLPPLPIPVISKTIYFSLGSVSGVEHC